MGYLEIPDWKYKMMYDHTVAYFLGMGYTLPEAKNEAATRMSRGWVARSTAIDLEYQKDDRDRANGAGPEGREWFE